MSDIISFSDSSNQPDTAPKVGDKVFVRIHDFNVSGVIDALSVDGKNGLIRLSDTVEATYDLEVEGYGQIWNVVLE